SGVDDLVHAIRFHETRSSGTHSTQQRPLGTTQHNVVPQRGNAPPPAPLGVCHRGWVFVASNDVAKQADHFLSSATRLPLLFFSSLFFAVTNVVRGREPSLRAKGIIAPRCVKAPS
ncbi:unnamed protein product, partial [Ectocarpus sp. 8 AP-2014]